MPDTLTTFESERIVSSRPEPPTGLSVAEAAGIYSKVWREADTIDNEHHWAKIGFDLVFSILEDLGEHRRPLPEVYAEQFSDRLYLLLNDLHNRLKKVAAAGAAAQQHVEPLRPPPGTPVPGTPLVYGAPVDEAERLWRACLKADEDFNAVASVEDDWDKPEIKKLTDAMTAADEALMNHETTTLQGILCKLEFIAHDEIEEDREHQVGRTINGLIRDLRRKLGRRPMHRPKGSDARIRDLLQA